MDNNNAPAYQVPDYTDENKEFFDARTGRVIADKDGVTSVKSLVTLAPQSTFSLTTTEKVQMLYVLDGTLYREEAEITEGFFEVVPAGTSTSDLNTSTQTCSIWLGQFMAPSDAVTLPSSVVSEQAPWRHLNVEAVSANEGAESKMKHCSELLLLSMISLTLNTGVMVRLLQFEEGFTQEKQQHHEFREEVLNVAGCLHGPERDTRCDYLNLWKLPPDGLKALVTELTEDPPQESLIRKYDYCSRLTGKLHGPHNPLKRRHNPLAPETLDFYETSIEFDPTCDLVVVFPVRLQVEESALRALG
ncbi:hypothetical protein TREMEDRAFT_65845 [Tremella mesenterica DSM 1558]|uniref:uncharacterized protein n=1 Tax=Tremella mesenterica (strain ATCC 24925 / CBS 8224 / DSM 1558 / NBRC 9311 / NRRL Y-6157 / RJB 2259-6 / UBC 559-6) TaxID=578456 RepID=UPI00032C1BD0|nr:uncharacterized protein TREMEDRAFT_65845 [Tremella mesenterica DSM 1558]EIW66234.1 hypothetical protein TREMEDRAFT_65845 [Tremella mesenterica DSM 1558]